jgi:23S rRNA (uracil1939-C5)-methyltransferase
MELLMIRGDFFTGRIERLAAGGSGIAHIEGQAVFVDYTAPGDLISGRITGTHKTWARGELLEIREPSADRVVPVCPLYGTCGGCSLQHLSYPVQLHEKEGMLRDALTRIGGVPGSPSIKTVPSPGYGCRNRVQFHAIPGTNRVGFKARKSDKIIPLEDCPIADEGIRQALGKGTLPIPLDRPRFSVYSRNNVLLCEGRDGPAAVRYLDRNIYMDAEVFFQGNAAVLEKLIPDLRALADRVEGALPAADIYCGVGTFAAFIRDRFSRIDMVEMSKTALDLARLNAAGEGCRYFALSADAWVRQVPDGEAYGFAVVDPPRQGLSPAIRRWLAEAGPPLLAYVSCDPATLARDSAFLRAGGYDLESVNFYDFYPQTAHIETLAVFNRRPVSDRRSIPAPQEDTR